MPSSYTTSARYVLQATGENLNTWGILGNNSGWSLVDTNVNGVSVVPVNAATVVLSVLNGQPDQARASRLVFTGTPPSNFVATIPAVPKNYRVTNNTMRVATVTTGGGLVVTVDPGDIIDLHTDGTDVRQPGVNGMGWKAYISSVAAGGPGGNVPSPIGNAGKWLTNDGTLSYWASIQSSNVVDFNAAVDARAIAFALTF